MTTGTTTSARLGDVWAPNLRSEVDLAERLLRSLKMLADEIDSLRAEITPRMHLLDLVETRDDWLQDKPPATAAGEPATGSDTTPTCGSGDERISRLAEVAAQACEQSFSSDFITNWPEIVRAILDVDEPTEAMIEAGVRCLHEMGLIANMDMDAGYDGYVKQLYRVMKAAR